MTYDVNNHLTPALAVSLLAHILIFIYLEPNSINLRNKHDHISNKNPIDITFNASASETSKRTNGAKPKSAEQQQLKSPDTTRKLSTEISKIITQSVNHHENDTNNRAAEDEPEARVFTAEKPIHMMIQDFLDKNKFSIASNPCNAKEQASKIRNCDPDDDLMHQTTLTEMGRIFSNAFASHSTYKSFTKDINKIEELIHLHQLLGDKEGNKTLMLERERIDSEIRSITKKYDKDINLLEVFGAATAMTKDLIIQD